MTQNLSISPSFALMYHCVVKNNTSLDQYETVNILLKGNTYFNNGPHAISQSAASNYVNGRKKINQTLLKEIFEAPQEEIIRRFRLLQLKDVSKCVYHLQLMINEFELFSFFDNQNLLNSYTDKDESQNYLFLAEFFLICLKYTNATRPFTDSEKSLLNFFYQEVAPHKSAEKDTIISNNQKINTANVSKESKKKMPSPEPECQVSQRPIVFHEIFKDYYILDPSSKMDLPKTPLGFWRIRLFTFLLRDASGKLFLPLHLHSYNSVWSVPHIAYKMKVSGRFTDVSMIVPMVTEASAELDDLFDNLESHQFYQMGIYNYKSKKMKDYVEYKCSVSLQGAYQCYHIEEYQISYLDKNELINVYGPLHIHGFHFLPLSDRYDVINTSPYIDVAPDGKGIWFFGHPLSSNIVNLIESLEQYKDCIYQLPDNVFLSEKGVSPRADVDRNFYDKGR